MKCDSCQLRTEIERLKNENANLKAENEKLQNHLRIYENPHTPPSQKRFPEKKPLEKPSEKKTRGAPKGHKGATKHFRKPDVVKEVTKDYCPRCSSTNIADRNSAEVKVAEEIPPPQKTIVTQYNLHKYGCLDCGHEFTASDEDCPVVGNFGPRFTTYVVMLKFFIRGVLRKITTFLEHQIEYFTISPTTVHEMLHRAGKACKVEYQRTLSRILKANWLHIDETSFSVLGKKWWLWLIRSNNNDVLVVMHPSRSSKVLKELFGENIDIPVIVDGWGAYNIFKTLQRCWSHMLREVKACKDKSKAGKELYVEVCKRFEELKNFHYANHSMDERKQKRDEWEDMMTPLILKYASHKELRKPLTYMTGGLGFWYNCLLYPGMPPTNNLGEQALRESVIIRKIIGCFRSTKGAENYQHIASVLASWKLQGKNLFQELENLLRLELCMTSA